ncbi:MAG TPA: amidohydrolase family protein [Longimicrobiales bacterium]
MRRASTLLAAALLAGAGAAPAQTVAITNARVHTMAGPVLERGTVVLRDGRIAAVGADVAIPAGARVIDATGKVVTPGFLDSATQLGLIEVGAVDGTRDMRVENDHITAAFNPADGLNPQSSPIAVTRVEGITRAVVAPSPGASLIAGQAVLIDLGAETPAGMVRASPVGMFAALGESGARMAGGARAAAILRLREIFQDVRDYAAHREAWASARRRDYALSRLDLEALVPVARGEVPLVLNVDRASDILVALRLGRELGVRLILTSVAEGWKVADAIAAAGVPVVINPLVNLPSRFEQLGATLENAARLEAAGVTVAFGTFDAHNSRNLKQAAGNAVAYGMPHEAALRAVTVNPARIWGVADRYGTLEVGKDADVVVWSGDPFELTTTVEHVFIRGREVPKDNRQRELFERYRTVGGAMPAAYRH